MRLFNCAWLCQGRDRSNLDPPKITRRTIICMKFHKIYPLSLLMPASSSPLRKHSPKALKGQLIQRNGFFAGSASLFGCSMDCTLKCQGGCGSAFKACRQDLEVLPRLASTCLCPTVIVSYCALWVSLSHVETYPEYVIRRSLFVTSEQLCNCGELHLNQTLLPYQLEISSRRSNAALASMNRTDGSSLLATPLTR